MKNYLCPLCKKNCDDQLHVVKCETLNEKETVNYDHIFSENDTVRKIALKGYMKLWKKRKEILDEVEEEK